ncbi:MAG: carboxypeptidase regulatory-like domain-containing protein [Thermoanaerobaculia bacterium]|nr:carboxypeptidase regulatory-like domain-containing protein [Thermoanaerobaculia bacterium]
MLRIRIVLVCLAVMVAIVPGALLGQSQATTGVIEGTVSEAGGAPLPGASVAIRNTATNFEKTTVTGSDGRFRGLALPLGPYRVTVTLKGFSTLVRDGLDLGLGQTINLTGLSLTLSQRAESITVTAAAPVVETTRAEGSTRIDDKAVASLPNNGRNYLDFTKLTPGVAIVQGPDGDELSINGQKGIQNNISVDGADFNNPFFGEQRGGQRPAFTFNLDAVKEVVVVADGANAEFGRSSSGFVNVVTKSGTNEFHGSAHGFYKDDSLSARPKRADDSSKPEFDFSQLQAGATLGGPLTKDKLFFFTSFDYQRGRSTKQTESGRIEQRVLDYFTTLGYPNENAPVERSNDARVFLAKLDWNINPQHLATVRYNYTWSVQDNGTFDVDSWGLSANASEEDKSNAVSGSLLSNFSSSVLNEFRGQFSREDRPRPYNHQNITGQNRPLPDTAFDFGRSYRFGEPFFIPVTYYDTRIQGNDNISFLAGKHEIKAGVEYNRVESNQTFLGFANGRYIFGSTDGFLNYARNPKYVECSDGSHSETGACPAGTTITGPLLLFLQFAGVGGLTAEQAGTQSIPQDEPAVFIQDKWQPLPNLTIQAGLRWEAQIEPDPITSPSQVFYAPFIGKTSKGQAFPSEGTIPSDKSMWQPRLGITWDPASDGKTVVRANGGIFYARIPGLVVASVRSTNGSVGQNIFRASFFNGFGLTPPTYPNLVPTAQTLGVPDHPDVHVFPADFQNPRTVAASVGVEREIGKVFGVLFKYNYARTTHLTQFLNLNDSLLGSPWSTGLPDGNGGTTNGIGGLYVHSSTGRSLYNGLTFGVNKRYTEADRWGFQLNYTLSWDKSDDDNERDPFTFRYAKVTDLEAEYGYSDRDQRHRLNGWFLWTAPGDVSVNLRYSYRSAQPQSITATGAIANTPQDRINANGTVVERNTGRKENEFSSLDLRVSRPFKFGSVAVEPILEVFNLFNSKNIRSPEVTNLIFNFDGTVQSGSGDPRQVQLGVRVVF